jgi:type III secretion protein J
VRPLLATLLLLAGCGVELEHGLDERQANQVLGALAQAGIDADKQADGQNGWTISVPRADTARAVKTLEARDLPRPREKGLGEAFGSSVFLPSAVEEQARLAVGTAVELGRTLEALPDVASARVHLALPPEELVPGDTPRARPTASVLLKTRGEKRVATADVQRLVAGAVPSLQPSDVTVVVTAGAADVPPELDRVGPLRVARESRGAATTLAASGLVAIALLSLSLALLGVRLQRARRRLRQLDPDA